MLKFRQHKIKHKKIYNRKKYKYKKIKGLNMYLNANIPVIECYVRGNYLRDQKDSHDKYFECVSIWFYIYTKTSAFVSLYDDRWWYLVESTYISIL